MNTVPSLTPKELIKILRRNGFILDRTRGSHQLWIHIEFKKRVVIPIHNKSLPKGTFYSILKLAGINKKDL
jgi:predicted RNA binding protein YcfA (HicA-like mRNA interferase family)